MANATVRRNKLSTIESSKFMRKANSVYTDPGVRITIDIDDAEFPLLCSWLSITCYLCVQYNNNNIPDGFRHFRSASFFLSLRYLTNLRSDTYGVRTPATAPVCSTSFQSSVDADISAEIPRVPIAIGSDSSCCFMANGTPEKWGLWRLSPS